MKKLKALIGLKVVSFGIWFYELGQREGLDFDREDEINLLKLRKLRSEFEAQLVLAEERN